MRLHKAYRPIVEPFLALGYRLAPTRNQHVAVLDPAGRRVVTLSGTPSDYRALANARAQLRRSLRGGFSC